MSNRTERWAWGLVVLLLSTATRAAPDLLPADGLAEAGLWRYWQTTLPLAGGEALTAIHQVEENLYCVTDHGVVFVVHADSGVIRWAEQVVLPGGTVFAPTHRVAADGERQVVITTSTHVRVYGIEYGDARGMVTLPFAPSTAAVADTDQIYVGSINQRFYCYRLADGIRIWHVRGTGPMVATPQLRGEDLYFASQDGRIYACHARDKRARWTARAGTAIRGDLAIGDKMVYAAGADRYVHAFDRETGVELWQRQLSPELFSGPLLVGDTLYERSEEAGVFALEPETGQVRWSRNGTFRFLARGGERVYTVDHTGDGVVLNNTTGNTIAHFEAANADLTLANTVDETLFLANHRGVLICVRRRGAPALRRARPARVAVAERNTVRATTQPTDRTVPPVPPPPPSPVDEIIDDPFRSRSNVPPLVGRSTNSSNTAESGSGK